MTNQKSFTLIKNNIKNFTLSIYGYSINLSWLFRSRTPINIVVSPVTLALGTFLSLRVSKIRTTINNSLMKFRIAMTEDIVIPKIKIVVRLGNFENTSITIILYWRGTATALLVVKGILPLRIPKIALAMSPTVAKFNTLADWDYQTLAILDVKTLAQMDSTTI